MWLVLSKQLYVNSKCCNGHFRSTRPVTHDYPPMVPSLALGRKGIPAKNGVAGPRKHTRPRFLCLPGEADKLCQFCVVRVVTVYLGNGRCSLNFLFYRKTLMLFLKWSHIVFGNKSHTELNGRLYTTQSCFMLSADRYTTTLHRFYTGFFSWRSDLPFKCLIILSLQISRRKLRPPDRSS